MKTALVLLTTFLLNASRLFADMAILVALPSEQGVLSKKLRMVGQPVAIAGHRLFVGYRKGEKVYFTRTGAGNLKSAMVAEALLARYKIDRIISIGVAGNLNEKWAVGDVLCVTNVVSHQEGKETPAGFEIAEEPSARQLSEQYKAKCEQLEKMAAEIAAGMLLPQNDGAANRQSQITVHEGRLVSGDTFIASMQKRKWLHETFHADAVDMISAGIARVCEANGVPYVIIRAVSDNADESAAADFAAFLQRYKEPITAQIAVGIIDRVAAETAHPLTK